MTKKSLSIVFAAIFAFYLVLQIPGILDEPNDPLPGSGDSIFCIVMRSCGVANNR